MRRTGSRATEAWLRARVGEARASGDAPASRHAATTLARWLASRDRDLDEAVDLAAGALQLGQDVELRRELSGWLESLGEPARAAAVLKPLASLTEMESTDAAYVLVRVGILRARAGAAAAAASAFEVALSVEPVDPLPAELLATLSTWEPDAVPASAAVHAYVEAARRHGALKQDDAELLDLWRGFTADPSSDAGALALADALERRVRGAAADEILRAHAEALAKTDPLGAARVHARRRESATLAREPTRALEAALDEGLDTHLEGEGSQIFDALLLDLGMLEVLAARLAFRAESATMPIERASQFVQLGTLHAGPLADRGRAAGAYVSAVAADPTSEEALAALRGLIETRDAAQREWADAGGRRDSVATVAAAIAVVGDEAERRAILAAKLRTEWPGVLSSDDDRGPGGRTSEAAIWVRASMGGGVRAQASALEQVATLESSPVRAVLLAVAADLHLAAGNATSARSAADLAIRTDPMSARCVAALADAAAAQHGDRWAATALECAIGMIGPRVSWCFALADAFEELGETAAAVGWSQRCASLRPGDRDAMQLLVERLVRAGDSSRLRDTLAWLLTQPQPVGRAAQWFAHTLVELARLDTGRACVIARRALDVFGPKSTPLREAMLGVADRASDDAFAAAILERWLSCGGGERSERRALLARLAEVRLRLGDDEGQARIAARAVGESMDGPEFAQSIEQGGERAVSPDAQLWRLRASAVRCAAGDDPAAAVWAWRDLGAALWDLADDRVGAVEAWQRAARVGQVGHTTLTLDLIAVAGSAFAFEYLARVADAEPDDAVSATIATAASHAALSVGEVRFAFDLAARAIGRCPASADSIDAAETAAQPAGEQAALSALYDLVALRALGRFGRRAAHYRGARWFERSGLYALALKHAAQAFYAVPSEGSTFQFLARMAERAGDRFLAVRTVEQVAEREQRPGIRAAWFLRAASIAGDGEDEVRRKFDVLLRAVAASPSVATVSLLRGVGRELLRFGPEERDGLELRFGHATRAVSGRLAGPEGARIAIAFATTLLELFADSDGAFRSVEGAFACDADVDEYGTLASHAVSLGQAPEARSRIAAMLATSESPHANVGVSALCLLAAIASAVGDAALRARASVGAALRAPDDDALTIEADDALRALGRLPGEVIERIGERLPATRRGAAVVAVARSRAAAGAHGDAAALFERAVELLDPSVRSEVERELRAALDVSGRRSEIEARAYREAAAEAGPVSARAAAWTQVAELREGRSDNAGAVRALLEACRLDPEPLERWSSLERVAEIAGDDGARVEALEGIWIRVKDDGRITVLKRLARAYERRGDLGTAEQAWRRLLALDTEDEEADQAMQSVIVARGDYDELVAHLARRADSLRGIADKRELLRAVRLRRAAILEQRLGRTTDACTELELLLSEWPNSVGALRYLADLLDRQFEFARSVPLWRRAAALEENPTDSAELEMRAARAERAAGDLEGAHTHSNQLLVLDAPPRFVEPGPDVRLLDLEAAVQEAKNPFERARARLALARCRLDFGNTQGAEPLLWEALAEGIIEAGDVLAPILASSPDRAADLINVRWQQVSLEPGDFDRLESLRVAALADDERIHARAVEHVLRAFDPGAGPLPPPPLAAQSEQQGILPLLARPSMDGAGEALALLWEGAMQLFVRDAASYGITGVERVLPGPSSPVARLYEVAMRVLDVALVPLFVTRAITGLLDSHVALMSPPAVILVGDVRQETAELPFELGRGIAAALPHNVLRQALPRAEGWAVVEALRTAFGPPELGRQVDPSVARLAESFWQIIPASGQRRLQELLRRAVLPDYETLVESALQTGRRVGMFLAGDFARAARMLLAESPPPDGAGGRYAISAPPSRENLRELCSRIPALADLLCLAVRSEYADARWHSAASAAQRRTESSGRFSVF